MTRASMAVILAALLWTPARQRPLTAAGLVQSVLDARRTTGFRAHATLTRRSGAVEKRISLLITGRRDGERTTVVYQVTSPRESTGHALVLQDAGDHHAAGARIDPVSVVRLNDTTLGDPFFDSDLRIEDLFEGFWYWPSKRLAGEENVGGRRALVVDLHPDAGAPTRYARVRAWIAPEQALPLRIEMFDRDDSREKRLTAGRIVKRDGRWAAARVVVEPANGQSRTVLEGSRFDRDLTLPASGFTIDAITRSVRQRR